MCNSLAYCLFSELIPVPLFVLEVFLSKDSNMNHDEFISINNVLKKYNEIKEKQQKNPRNPNKK